MLLNQSSLLESLLRIREQYQFLMCLVSGKSVDAILSTGKLTAVSHQSLSNCTSEHARFSVRRLMRLNILHFANPSELVVIHQIGSSCVAFGVPGQLVLTMASWLNKFIAHFAVLIRHFVVLFVCVFTTLHLDVAWDV